MSASPPGVGGDLVGGVSAHTNGLSPVADVLADLGYTISATVESLKEALHPFPTLTEHDVASIIIMILRTQYARLHGEGDDSTSHTSSTAASNPAPSSKGKKATSKSPAAAAAAAAAASKDESGWQIQNVIDAIKDLNSKLVWKNILEVAIDQKKFFIYDEKSYQLFVDIYRYATTPTSTRAGSAAASNAPVSIDFMLREWKNTVGQLSLLRWALPSTLTVFAYPPLLTASPSAPSATPSAWKSTKPQGTDDADDAPVLTLSSTGAVPPSKTVVASDAHQSWLSLDILTCLLEPVPAWSPSAASFPVAVDSPALALASSLRGLLDRSPELRRILAALPMHVSITPHESVAASFYGANAQQKIGMMRAVVKYWMMTRETASPAALALPGGALNASPSGDLLTTTLIALGQRLKSFLEVRHSAPISFELDVYTSGVGAGAPSVVPFVKWLKGKSDAAEGPIGKKAFLSALATYLKDSLPDQPATPSDLNGARISVETVAALVKAIANVTDFTSPQLNDAQAYFKNQPVDYMSRVGGTTTIHGAVGGGGFGAQQLHTSAMGGMSASGMDAPMHDASMTAGAGVSDGGAASSSSREDLEKEANANFQKVYSGAMSVDAMVDMLVRLRNSSVPRERDVCQCMIFNLFDEYKFFSKYPPKELQITGILFGALVQHKLVHGYTLGIALRFVLESLRKYAADSKMFSFGLWSIGQFKARIHAWPQYAALIAHIPHVQTAQPDLYAFLQAIVQQHASATAQTPLDPEVDFTATGATTPFGIGFHSDPLSFQAEGNADLAAATAKGAVDRASAAANLSIDAAGAAHLPPGLGIGAKGPSTPGPALAAGLLAGGSAPHNPAGTIGGTRGATATTAVTGATPASAAGVGGAAGSSFGATLNIDSLLSAEGDAPLPLAPSESLKDKIHWIINNVTKSNLRQKGRELKSVLRAEFLPYFSRYLVIKRVSIEANFQRLYAAFLDYVGIPELRKIMLETTYYNIQVLLRNDKIVSSSSERSLLKNLGSWLGLLTIAKNKPIRSKYLDLKTLILEAYDTGRLIAVIPFCAKVLESCADSRVFKPPNPWLMAVVGLLREIFDLPGLKLNLKFEIEVLFNHLVINMKEVRSTNLLKHHPLHVRDIRMEREEKQRAGQAQQAQAGAAAGAMGASRTPFPLLPTPNPLPPLPKTGVPPLKAGVAGSALVGIGGAARSPSPNMSEEDALRLGAFGPPSGATAGAPLAGGAAGNADSLLIPNLSQYVVISPTIALFQMSNKQGLTRCVSVAIDRAIREIINPVVERSLAIACVTTRELILKDFAAESDETKLRLAANSMVSNLTSSLALVTCREPLRVSITNHLTQLLEANTAPSERPLVERACHQISADNLDLGTTLIEKAASERAIREIDEQLAPVYQVRRKQRENTGTGYVDLSAQKEATKYNIPDFLRAKPGVGLQPSQLRVYEDFKTIRSQHAAAAAAPPQTGTERPTTVGQPGATSTTPGAAPSLLRAEDEKKQAAAAAALSASAFAAPRGGPQIPPTAGIPPQAQASAPLAPAPSAGQPSTRSPPLGAQQAGAQPSNLTAQQTLDKLLGYLATLEQAVLRFPNHKSIPLHSLTSAGGPAGAGATQENLEINGLMRSMAVLLQQTSRDESNYPKDLVPLTFALKVFKRLYERENRSSLLQIDVHIGVLKCVRAVCPKLLPELTAWLLYADDDRKFILPITAGLLRARLLNTSELDLFLSKLATNLFTTGQAVTTITPPPPAPGAPQPQPTTPQLGLHQQFEFILTLVRRVVVKRPIVSVGELSQLLETLTKIGQQAAAHRTKILADHIAHLLEDVRTAAQLAEKERADQERQLRVGQQASGAPSDALDAKSLLGADGGLSGLMPPLSLLDTGDETDALDRMPAEEPEPTGLRQQVTYLLDDWMNICLQQGQASDKAYSAYLQLLQQQRLLATPEATQKFFRVIIQLCVDAALASVVPPPASGAAGGQQEAPSMSYTAIDALAKLFVFLLKWTNLGGFSGDKYDAPSAGPQATPSNTASKIALLRSFLSAAVYVLRKDHAQKNAAALANAASGSTSPQPTAGDKTTGTFNQRPYLRLFNNLLHDLNTPDPLLDSNNVEVLACFATHFRFLRPQRCPAFLFAWLELIAHRMFMSKLLISKTPGCSILFARLLIDLFRFLQPYLRQADLTEVLRLAYKGTLRLLLVLLHDFPEFLCEFHFSFCDVIPTSCIQMRNLILSAFPRSMRLPDPFTPNLKVDLLPEMTQSPRMLTDVSLLLQQPQHRHTLLMPLEHYLKHREPQTFFKQMLDSLTLRSAVLNTPPPTNAPPPSQAQLEALHTAAVKRAGTPLNVPLINALVMYTGLAGINSLLVNQGKSGLVSQFSDSASMDVYEALLQGLDAEGRYYVLNAIANQLRFPNNHTHYFSCVLLYLFLQCKDEVLMEQMTRVLLERLIVHRPHPWGLLITFIELIKNPRYNLWAQPFTRCAPEIERLFESVARSCMPVTKQQQVGGAIQPGTNGAALGASVGAGNSAAAQAMMIADAHHQQAHAQ